MNDLQRRAQGKLYDPFKIDDGTWQKSRVALKEFYSNMEPKMELLKDILGSMPNNAYITPPFYFDHGDQIFLGEHFYSDTDLLILDETKVVFGDNVVIGPRCSIYTACHPIDAMARNSGLEFAKEVVIGNNVWIGGNVVINPGVHIGDNTVIGSGSVVTKNIPSNVIAAGNACKVIREITDDDAKYWAEQKALYEKDNR